MLTIRAPINSLLNNKWRKSLMNKQKSRNLCTVTCELQVELWKIAAHWFDNKSLWMAWDSGGSCIALCTIREKYSFQKAWRRVFWSYHPLFANFQHLTKKNRGKLKYYKVSLESLSSSANVITKMKEDKGFSCCNCTCTNSVGMNSAHFWQSLCQEKINNIATLRVLMCGL